MNLNADEGLKLIAAVSSELPEDEKAPLVIIAPPMHYLTRAAEVAKGSRLLIAAQNCSQHDDGAFTGEVSASMLKSSEIGWVILGHSERRQYFSETDGMINAKVQKALEVGLKTILCVGEMLEDRQKGMQEEVVERQLKQGLQGLASEDLSNLVIAYEPVWAIGTGETASPEQAQQMHAFIRRFLTEQFDEKTAQNMSILYGGSVKPANADEIFGQEDVDGGLVGGASLKEDSFKELVRIGKEQLQ